MFAKEKRPLQPLLYSRYSGVNFIYFFQAALSPCNASELNAVFLNPYGLVLYMFFPWDII